MSQHPTSRETPSHPGSRYGLPDQGAGSVAGWGVRVAALVIDWVAANFAAVAIARDSSVWSAQSSYGWLPWVVWFVEVWLLTSLTGSSFGQRFLRITVLRLDHRRVGLLRGFVRTALIALIIPPLVFDRDGRGLHYMAVGTIVVKGPSSR